MGDNKLLLIVTHVLNNVGEQMWVTIRLPILLCLLLPTFTHKWNHVQSRVAAHVLGLPLMLLGCRSCSDFSCHSLYALHRHLLYVCFVLPLILRCRSLYA